MRTALDVLLSPVGEERFFRDHWERRHLHVKRDDPEYFAALFSASDLPQVIAAAAQATRRQSPQEVPFVEIIARAEMPRPVATSPTAAAVYAAFESGSTVRLNHMHRYWPPMRSYVQQLESELGFVTGLSVYCSPAEGRGLGPHFDAHDNVVVQIAGSKRWRVAPGPVLPLESVPLLPFETREEMRNHRVPAPPYTSEEELEEILLEPGDFLYVPRGYIHDVQALSAFTVHVTFGIQQITWIDFLSAVAAAAGLRDERLRRSIPVRYHRTSPAAMQAAADEALRAFGESASAREAFAAITGQFERAAAGSSSWDEEFSITPETRMKLAPAISIAYEESTDDVALVASATRILGPPSYSEAFHFLASSRSFAPRNIPGLPPGEQLAIARRLLHEGLYLTPAAAPPPRPRRHRPRAPRSRATT